MMYIKIEKKSHKSRGPNVKIAFNSKYKPINVQDDKIKNTPIKLKINFPCQSEFKIIRIIIILTYQHIHELF